MRHRQAGFALPTAVLLVLVLLLLTAALIVRSYDRTQQVGGERASGVIYNQASPAIDRAKAKLKFLFSNSNTRYPPDIPNDDLLLEMLHDRNVEGGQIQNIIPFDADPEIGPYDFLDETRLDLDGDTRPDNAWYYSVDTDNDGQPDSTAVYAILSRTKSRDGSVSLADVPTDAEKAENLIVRAGPVGNKGLEKSCPAADAGVRVGSEGWFSSPGAESNLEKSFQIIATTFPNTGNTQLNRTISALELQQDRSRQTLNNYGAWFRTDLEILSGSQFDWNGRIHTEGSLFIGDDKTTLYMVSSPASCFYSDESSKITVMKQIVAGSVRGATGKTDSTRVHIFAGAGAAPTTNEVLTNTTDSVTGEAYDEVGASIALDPEKIVNENLSEPRDAAGWTPIDAWKTDPGGQLSKRIELNPEEGVEAPYVDDTYRADERYGPSASLMQDEDGTVITKAGVPVNAVYNPDDEANFNPENPSPIANGDLPGVLGNARLAEIRRLDGYWEQRAQSEGMRVIVGQRLELTDVADPFDKVAPAVSPAPGETEQAKTPPSSPTDGKVNEGIQRTSLRDSLKAVQATAVYHWQNPGGSTVPLACLSNAFHPGTGFLPGETGYDATVDNLKSRFLSNDLTATATTAPTGLPAGAIASEFFGPNFIKGIGTNGREYAVPAGGFDAAAGTPLGSALRNLVELKTKYPERNYGDFSKLQRALASLGAGGALSIADKSYIDTAACTLGILASSYDIDAAITAEATPGKEGALNTIFVSGTAGPVTPASIQLTEVAGAARKIPVVTKTFGTVSIDVPAIRDSAFFDGREHMQIRSLNLDLDQLRQKTIGTDTLLPASGVVYAFREDAVRDGAPVKYYTEPGLPTDLALKDRVLNNHFNRRPYGFRLVEGADLRRLGVDANKNIYGLSFISANPVYIQGNFNLHRDGSGQPVEEFSDIKLRTSAYNEANFYNRQTLDPNFARPTTDQWRPSEILGDTVSILSTSFRDGSTEQSFVENWVATPIGDPKSSYFNQNMPDRAGGFNPGTIPSYRIRTALPAPATDDAIDFQRLLFAREIWEEAGNPTAPGANWDAQGANSPVRVSMQGNPVAQVLFRTCATPSGFCITNVGGKQYAELDIAGGTAAPAGTSLVAFETGTTANTLEIETYPVGHPKAGEPVIDPVTQAPIPIPKYLTFAYRDATGGNRQKFLNVVQDENMEVNAMLISGVVPSRKGQYNGGFQNFPRFNEYWSVGGTAKDLFISGSFIQLNFSAYGTAPYDQETFFTPTATPAVTGATEVRPYYEQPSRKWGFDVGLLYAPASAVSRRLAPPGQTPRSEFYRELSADDPYIKLLRCAAPTGTKLDPSATCP